MLLNADEIRSRGLVAEGASDGSYRASTYDVTVGLILTPSGKSLVTHTLKSQEIAVVVSRETLCMPSNVSGHAVPRTSLAEQGLLALSTGVVDPGYRGPLSSVVINFGADDLVIEEGTPFLRVFFQQIAETSEPSTGEPESRDLYIRTRRSYARGLPETFLDLPNQARAIANQIASARIESLARILSVGGVLLVILTFLGAPFVGQIVGGDSLSVADVRSLQELDSAPLRDDIEEIRATVAQLTAAAGNEISPDRLAALEAAVLALSERVDDLQTAGDLAPAAANGSPAQ